MTDEINEEIEHIEFITECNKLIESIMWAIANCSNVSANEVKTKWDEVVVFGDEPVFASLLFDYMIAEAQNELS